MNIRTTRSRINKEIMTKCPFGKRANTFKPITANPIYVVGGWNCVMCERFKGVKDVALDGYSCTVICGEGV